MLKKGYIRTEIEKYLLELSETTKLTPDLVFEHLPEIYKLLKEDENNLLPDHITYEVFVQGAQKGFDDARIQEMLRQARGF